MLSSQQAALLGAERVRWAEGQGPLHPDVLLETCLNRDGFPSPRSTGCPPSLVGFLVAQQARLRAAG